MYKYFFLIITLITFNACSSENAHSDGRSISEVYFSPSISYSYANNKQTSVTSLTNTPMLVVLLNYSNIKITSSMDTWAKKIYSKDFGHLNDYYQEISNSKFEFSEATECNGIASVTINKKRPDTNIDSNLFNNILHPDLSLAILALDKTVSFDIYDTNGDGHIQANELLITFIMAGYEDAYEGNHATNGIWAHQNCVDASNTPLVDGVTLMGCNNNGNYAIFGEKHNISNPHDATIGIIAHELGHAAFNLPDLYLGGGIGAFGLMGAGTWGMASSSQYAGQTPVHMSAWSKEFNNWIVPDEINGSIVINDTKSTNYNIIKIQNGTKHFLIENRANRGYDRGLFILDGSFAGGIAIWDIDESKITQANLDNNSINSLPRGVSLINAQGGYVSGNGNENALFYDVNINSFLSGNANITNISVRGAAMTLDIN